MKVYRDINGRLALVGECDELKTQSTTYGLQAVGLDYEIGIVSEVVVNLRVADIPENLPGWRPTPLPIYAATEEGEVFYISESQFRGLNAGVPYMRGADEAAGLVPMSERSKPQDPPYVPQKWGEHD